MDRKKERKNKKREDKAVKIDAEIACKVKTFISKKENKIRFASIKQFIDIAVLDKLEKEEGIEEKSSLLGKETKPEELKREINYLIKKEARVPSGII